MHSVLVFLGWLVALGVLAHVALFAGLYLLAWVNGRRDKARAGE